MITSVKDYIDIILELEATSSVNSCIYRDKPSQTTMMEIQNVRDEFMNCKGVWKNDTAYFYSIKDEMYSHFFSMNSRNSNTSNGVRYYFRGQSNIKYRDKICSGIYREKEKHDEQYYLNNIEVRCFKEIEKLSSISKLTYMQHYGCPTRLLDITNNPLVALYFACNGNPEQDGVVFAFNINEKDVCFSRSDKVLMLSKLTELDKSSQEHILCLAYLFLTQKGFPKKSTGEYKDRVLEMFFHKIKKEHSGFEREIVPLDLLQPIFVQTPLDNPRILKQDGAFIMSGLDFDCHDSNMKIKKFMKSEIVIPAEKKENIIIELEKLCINSASLFPEMDRVSEYLKR